MPYIITIDLNYDNQCRDAFYQLDKVSRDSGLRGINGLVKVADDDLWEIRASVVAWSFGPDRTVNSSVRANEGVNKDNVLSWKQ